MKKKLLLTLVIVIALVSLFAIGVSAADEVTVVVDGGTETVDFEEVFKLSNGYVAGFVDSTVYGKHNVQDVIFPATIVGFNNSSKEMFKESTVLKSITFKGTAVEMNDCSSVFYKSSIESVIFEQGHDCILNVHRYTKSVFQDCASLKTVKFPTFTKLNSDGTSDTGDALGHMFANCSSMVAQNDIVFGEGVVSLGGQMIFANCSSLNKNAEGKCEVYFPSTIKAINHRSFQNAAITAIHLDGCSSLESIGSTTGSEGTLSGTKLTSIDFSDCTNLNYLCSKVLGDNTSLTTVIGFENTAVESIPTNAFNGCTALTTISFPSTLETIGEKAFYKCTALTGTYTFSNVTSIAKESFRYAATAENSYLSMSFPSIVTLGGSSNDQHVFSNSGVRELYFGNTIKNMSHNTFSSATKLWRLEFQNGVSDFSFVSYTFEGCTSLAAFSIPDGITQLPSRMFKDCTSLKAVYLPKALTAINSGDNDSATFKNCKNLYFVSEPFTYKTLEDIPAEPSVYYFPSTLVTMTGETFDGSRLNDYVVFPTGITDLSDGYTFEGSTSKSGKPTVIFLGDVQSTSIKTWGVNEVYFCHPNDVDATSVGLSGSATIHYCNAEGNTTHLYLVEKNTAPSCTKNGVVGTVCFCGAANPTSTVIPAQHDYGKELSYNVWVWENDNYFANANYKHTCQICSEEYIGAVVANSYLFIKEGFATFANKDGETIKSYDFQYSIKVNTDAMDNYTEETGNVIKYGTVAGVGNSLTNPISYENGTLTVGASAAVSDMTGTDFVKLLIKVTSIPVLEEGVQITCNAYAIVDDKLRYVGETTVTENAQFSSIK